MRILQLSTFDARFGASIAARRLHEGLVAAGRDCSMLVSDSQTDSPGVYGPRSRAEKVTAKIRLQADKLPLTFYPKRTGLFSPSWMPSTIERRVAEFRPKIVHLHWCQSDFVPTSSLPYLGRVIIWTFHDMWAFTGGCHYTTGCERYLETCGTCPILGSTREGDLSRWLWRQKRSVYRRIRPSLHVICPSNWMAGVARQAPLLEGVPVHAVPNPINAQVFKPIDKIAARRLLGLPERGHLLLLGATSRTDRRKGFDLLDEALRQYATQPGVEPLGVVTLENRNKAQAAAIPNLQTWNIGFLQDEVSLAALYNAVDVMALPSREENLSNALAEALSCGTPCLAFAIGGNGDLVTHLDNGYLAKASDTADMSAGLKWILENLGEYHRERIASAAHAKLSYETLIPAFLDIYQNAVAR